MTGPEPAEHVGGMDEDLLNDILQDAIGDGEGRIYARDVLRHLQRHGYAIAKLWADRSKEGWTSVLEPDPPVGLYRVRDADGRVVCTVDNAEHGRLIAAARDLLAALTAMVRDADALGGAVTAASLAAARAALARAAGG